MKYNKKLFLILIITILVILTGIFIFLNKKNTETVSDLNKILETEETSPFLPQGATVVNKELDTGIVIKDKNNNEWVWIEVPKSVTAKANTEKEIEEALEKYVMVDSTEKNELIVNKQGHTESYHKGIGLTEEQYKTRKSEILKSIKVNGGFYIGRYETGYNISENVSARLSASEKTPQVPVIQANAYPYNYVTNEQAEKLSESLSIEGSRCGLMLGLQYDLVFKYMNVKGKITPKEITEDSTKIGNYSNNSNFNMTLLTTGASDETKILNIYDIAGNVFEWTLEKGLDDKYPCSYIGGCYRDKGSDLPCSKRFGTTETESRDYIGFRATMY